MSPARDAAPPQIAHAVAPAAKAPAMIVSGVGIASKSEGSPPITPRKVAIVPKAGPMTPFTANILAAKPEAAVAADVQTAAPMTAALYLSLIHISEPTRPY